MRRRQRPRLCPFAVGIVCRAALVLFREAVEHWRSSQNGGLIVTTLCNVVVLLAPGCDKAAALAATLELHAPVSSYGREADRIASAVAAVHQRLGDAASVRPWSLSPLAGDGGGCAPRTSSRTSTRASTTIGSSCRGTALRVKDQVKSIITVVAKTITAGSARDVDDVVRRAGVTPCRAIRTAAPAAEPSSRCRAG